MKHVNDLTRDQLMDIVSKTHTFFFYDTEYGRYDAGMQVNGGDLVEELGDLWTKYGMVPEFDSTKDEVVMTYRRVIVSYIDQAGWICNVTIFGCDSTSEADAISQALKYHVDFRSKRWIGEIIPGGMMD
jgi:hypothetical protein